MRKNNKIIHFGIFISYAIFMYGLGYVFGRVRGYIDAGEEACREYFEKEGE